MKVSDLLTIAAGRKLSHDEACGYLTQVGLCARDYLNRDVDTSLSGGEVKRIEIATILAKNAELMIFDEPEAGIDLWSFARLTETFRMLHDRQERTLIIISHQERIIRLADEIVLVEMPSQLKFHLPPHGHFEILILHSQQNSMQYTISLHTFSGHQLQYLQKHLLMVRVHVR